MQSFTEAMSNDEKPASTTSTFPGDNRPRSLARVTFASRTPRSRAPTLRSVWRVVVVGAGIGGLCAARAVALAGLEPKVLERSPAGTTVGAGLLLWPNAVHALDALGHGRAVRAIAVPVRRTVLRDGAGRSLSEMDVEALGRRAGAPMLVVERPALQAVLGEGVAVLFDAAVTAVDERGVMLASGERIDSDAVIGADGIGSVARRHVCPSAQPLDSGYTVIRGIAEHDIGRGESFEAWGRGELVGGAALPAGRSFWFYEAPSARIDGKDPPAAVGTERWPAPIPAQLAATPPEGVLVNRILRLGVLPTWTRGRVALLGDAIHAMEPNLGQGAAQAIEDASALLIALGAGGELSGSLAAYAGARRARARMLQRESSRYARLALSTHTGLRDLMMRVSPEPLRRRAMERLMRRHAPRWPAAA
jgi:2-polyprenyl-6-methoxyphenol hydroxylase-like FAD-dependent oxidoreductase